MVEVKKLVTEVSGRRGNECYYIFCLAVEVALNRQPEEPKMKSICTEVQKILGKKSNDSVSKALSRAVEDIWEHGNIERLQQIFGRPVLEKPTPKDVITVMSQYLWEGLVLGAEKKIM